MAALPGSAAHFFVAPPVPVVPVPVFFVSFLPAPAPAPAPVVEPLVPVPDVPDADEPVPVVEPVPDVEPVPEEPVALLPVPVVLLPVPVIPLPVDDEPMPLVSDPVPMVEPEPVVLLPVPVGELDVPVLGDAPEGLLVSLVIVPDVVLLLSGDFAGSLLPPHAATLPSASMVRTTYESFMRLSRVRRTGTKRKKSSQVRVRVVRSRRMTYQTSRGGLFSERAEMHGSCLPPSSLLRIRKKRGRHRSEAA